MKGGGGLGHLLKHVIFFFGTIWCAIIFFSALYEIFWSIFFMQDSFSSPFALFEFCCCFSLPLPLHFSSGASLRDPSSNFDYKFYFPLSEVP